MTPATMDSSSLVCVEDGSVELLEFTWPPVGPDDSEDTPRASCLCYAVMRRPGGFLLCLPSGFVPADVLRAGEEASAGDLVGLSTGLSVPPISLTDEGDWVRPTDAAPVPALVLDLSDAGAECLAQADLQVSDAAPFVLDRPGIFPLASEVASEVLRQARAWAASGSQPDRSGYQTAVSDAPGARQVKAGPRPKRPTVAQLASQQEALSKAVAGIAEQLTALRAQGDASPGPRKPAPTPLPGQLSLLAAPVSSHLAQPPVDPRTSLPELLGPPPSPSELQSFFERPGPSRGGAHWFRRRCSRAASSRGPLERLPCRGNAAAVKGSERTGVPALPVSGPPRSGPLDGRRLWTLDPRHLRKAEDASRAPPSGRLLRTAAPADRLETHIPYGHRECRAGPHDTVLRAVRRFWKPKAARSSPVPAGPGQRPPCTRLPCRGLRLGSPAHHNDRPGQRRWWQARPRLSFQPSAGPAFFGVREPPVSADGCPQALLSAGRLPVGCLDPGLREGARDPLEQTPRVRDSTEKAGRPCTLRQGPSSYSRRQRHGRGASPYQETATCESLGEPPGRRGKLTSSPCSSPACAGQPASVKELRAPASHGRRCTLLRGPEVVASNPNSLQAPREAAPLSSRYPPVPGVSRGPSGPPGLQSPSGPVFSEPESHQSRPKSFAAGTFDRKTDFWAWAAALPRLILATRTSFSRFLASTFPLRPGSVTGHPTALFPLPIPKPGCFDAGKDPEATPRSLSLRRRLLLDRVLHVVVMGLNFLHSNFRHVPAHVLQRLPSPCQLQVFDRLRVLLRACSRSAGSADCAPLCFGRRGVHLVARLSELTSYLSGLGLGHSSYLGVPTGVHVQHHDGGPESLRPYRDTDPGGGPGTLTHILSGVLSSTCLFVSPWSFDPSRPTTSLTRPPASTRKAPHCSS